MVEYCEIYITGVRKLNIGWCASYDAFLDEVADNISDIERFNFISISLNMSQVYNFHLKVSSYDAMLIYIKGVRYFGFSYLNERLTIELEEKLKLYLSYVYGLTFDNIEIRCAKKFEYEELEG